MVALGGCVWLLWGGMRGCSGGACVVALGGVHGCSGGGMHGCSVGACMVARGACVVARGGMRGFFDEIRSMSGRYASYWNAFLLIFGFEIVRITNRIMNLIIYRTFIKLIGVKE